MLIFFLEKFLQKSKGKLFFITKLELLEWMQLVKNGLGRVWREKGYFKALLVGLGKGGCLQERLRIVLKKGKVQRRSSLFIQEVDLLDVREIVFVWRRVQVGCQGSRSG
jgi:hypothetical protein